LKIEKKKKKEGIGQLNEKQKEPTMYFQDSAISAQIERM